MIPKEPRSSLKQLAELKKQKYQEIRENTISRIRRFVLLNCTLVHAAGPAQIPLEIPRTIQLIP